MSKGGVVDVNEFDRQVAIRLRANKPIKLIAEELGASRGRVYRAADRLRDAGVIRADKGGVTVKNVVAGYRQERGEDGLTARFRSVRDGLVAGKVYADIGAELGVSKQRVCQVASALTERGYIRRTPTGWERLR